MSHERYMEVATHLGTRAQSATTLTAADVLYVLTGIRVEMDATGMAYHAWKQDSPTGGTRVSGPASSMNSVLWGALRHAASEVK